MYSELEKGKIYISYTPFLDTNFMVIFGGIDVKMYKRVKRFARWWQTLRETSPPAKKT